MTDLQSLENTLVAATGAAQSLKSRLLRSLSSGGFWPGRLSGSAVATATAGFALYQTGEKVAEAAATRAMTWLAGHRHADGGWGDSPDSPSNLTATLLVWAALTHAARERRNFAPAREQAAAWLAQRLDVSRPAALRNALQAAYGDDRTFCAPILAMAAMAGCLGDRPGAWDHVPALPFEAAVMPRRLYRWLRIPVVSYGLPALIAVGLVRHRGAARAGPVATLRTACSARALRVLESIQPAHGGFLDAAPLTAFVVMSLCHAGCTDSPVWRRGMDFLLRTQRADGSWPIDTGLPAWVTTLSVKALVAARNLDPEFTAEQRGRVRDWLLDCQFRRRHPFTGAAPGGWGWTDASGGVPDADDTAGALIALHQLDASGAAAQAAAHGGVRWLMDLQNSDGGIPTFCRGFGRLPFDRSSPDLTAHAMRAMVLWQPCLQGRLQRCSVGFLRRALDFLRKAQAADGTWLPLWFGCQQEPQRRNPVFGTAQVLLALQALPEPWAKRVSDLCGRGTRWLQSAQATDGGWGAAPGLDPGIEETALAVQALAAHGASAPVRRGMDWLSGRIAEGVDLPSRPIGLYFANLWYSEQMYPYVFALAGLAAGIAGARASVPCGGSGGEVGS